MPHRLSSRKEPPAPTHQPSRATFCIRRTQDAIYKFIAPGAKHRARGHMDAQGAWGGPRPPFGAFMNRPRSKISGDTLLEQMRRDQQIIPSRSIIQFGDDDDLHARAHLRAHNDYKFAHAPATAVVATYAKAQANIVDGGGGGGGGASRARCAGAQIDGIAPPERGRPTSPVAFNVSSIARYAGAVQRARHERRRCLFCHVLI